ncbi:hypothetical protein B0J13DRAFT_677818 [Dactylonectria estremocensis]|uniref:Fucose-specific lectin n=1 Tax=Dactylonectria estremocensis TaxID=1079267 RepID=A0A9P9IT80_9HYPO|nr:hypothetical protein B0J13DRAFT_677818 [Dactylonectria estremocensis]
MLNTASFTNLPEVYIDPHANAPQVLYIEHRNNHTGSPESYPEALYAPKPDDFRTNYTGRDAPFVGKPDRGICGLKRRVFFILVAVSAFLVIGAIVGGVAGVTLTKKTSSSDSKSSSSPNATTISTATATISSSSSTASTTNIPSATSNNTSVLPKSGIASVNWTDTAGLSHYYVFHQNRSNDLIASIWDSQGQTWETVSVSASLREWGFDFDLVEGTPISAVAWSDDEAEWNIRVYAVRTGNYLVELKKNLADIDGRWVQKALGSSQWVKTAEGSNIAAWRPNGGEHDDPIVLLYQNEDQHLAYSTSEDWTDTQSLASIPVTNSSGLAISSFAMNGNTSDIAWGFYFDCDNTMRRILVEPDLSTLTIGPNGLGDMSSSSKTNFAAIRVDEVDVIVADTHNDGRVVARWLNQPLWSTPTSPTLKGSPDDIKVSEGFTGIAGNSELRMYGIVNGEIHEWSFVSNEPMEWNYEGQVKTALDG